MVIVHDGIQLVINNWLILKLNTKLNLKIYNSQSSTHSFQLRTYFKIIRSHLTVQLKNRFTFQQIWKKQVRTLNVETGTMCGRNATRAIYDFFPPQKILISFSSLAKSSEKGQQNCCVKKCLWCVKNHVKIFRWNDYLGLLHK